jgi:hypothetical protein
LGGKIKYTGTLDSSEILRNREGLKRELEVDFSQEVKDLSWSWIQWVE